MISSSDGDIGPELASSPTLTIYLVKRLELAVRGQLNSIVRDYDLTTPQYTALSVLRDRPGLSSAQLSRRSFVSPQAGNELVGALETKGLITRSASPSNRKVLKITLTDRGRDVLAECDAAVQVLEDRMLAWGTSAEVRAGRAFLDCCVASLTSGEAAPSRGSRTPQG